MSVQELVLATSNHGKLIELEAFLTDLPFKVLPQNTLGISDAEETGLTFVENALIKARHATEKAQLPALADDSGLVVDALAGEPGIYSARYAGDHVSADAHMDKLLNALHEVPFEKRTAHFHCTLVLMRHALDPAPLICQGIWHGLILFKKRGQGGLGYDPLFYVPSYHCSAAELSVEAKNKISHRGQALAQLSALLSSFPDPLL